MKNVRIGDICDVIGGFAFKSSQMKDSGGKYQVVKMGNLYQGTLDLQRNPSFLDEIDSRQKEFLLKEGDILITLTGTIGKRDYGYTVKIGAQKNLLLNQRVCVIRPIPSRVNGDFLFQQLKTKSFLDEFFESSIGGTGNQSNVSINVLKNFLIPLPGMEEQIGVSALLSTWEAAIEKTERLIAAKERRLQWLRQQITTGKTKLPDSAGKWKKVRLSEVLTEHGGLSTGQEEVCSVSVHKGVVNQVEHLGRVFAAKDTSNYNLVKPGDIIYTKSPTGNFPLGIVKQSKLDRNVIVSPLYGVFTPRTVDLGIILDCYFESEINTRNYLGPIIQKGAKNTINITNTTFLSNSLFLPMDPVEQRRIASVLSTAKLEISLLKERADAYRKQKRGLMQKLLTGRWRLKAG